MSQFDFSGAITALVTPFYDGAVDFSSLQKLLRQQLDAGIDGLVINGTTGESPTLTSSEVAEVFNFVKAEVSGQVPLILGAGTNSTHVTIENTRRAGELRADAALVVTPYYNKPPQQGLLSHFREVADRSKIPVLLYNVPGRTITSLSVETIASLSEHPMIVGVKEATGDMDFGNKVISSCSEGFLVTSGDDGSCLDLTLAGGKGVISVISNIIPGEIKDLIAKCRAGDEVARSGYVKKYAELLDILYCESNPIPVKMACQQMGLIRSPEMRLPLVKMSEGNASKLKEVLKGLELL